MSDKKYYYSEIFYSIQGEGHYTGVPTAWIRFFLCNLQCNGFGQKDPTNPETYELPYEDFDPMSVNRVEDLPVWKHGIDVSAPRTSLSPSGRVVVQGRNVVHSGKIYASGSSGGKVDVISSDSVKLDGSILAKGDVSKGGQVIIISENAIQTSSKTIIDVSGQYKGGQIRALANKTNKISGILNADEANEEKILKMASGIDNE